VAEQQRVGLSAPRLSIRVSTYCRQICFRWLDRGYQQHEYLMEVKVDPWFNSIRGDPRYKALLQKLKLPE